MHRAGTILGPAEDDPLLTEFRLEVLQCSSRPADGKTAQKLASPDGSNALA
jgi:hypothetical protein